MVPESKFENSKHTTFNLILLGNGIRTCIVHCSLLQSPMSLLAFTRCA